jgi:UDP-N-acetylmuramoyl-tripeptide--D-alanyl-D-alanine ligase
LTGLQSLARCYRESLGLRVVGITGSNGKTSTKDLVASILRQSFSVNATKGNLNNHIGLPLSILATEAGDDFGVFEMGMSNPGEIEVLADIAQPNVGIITNVGVAHIEYMKTQQAIAEEKGMLAEAIPASGCMIFNGADEYTDSIAKRTVARMVMTGREGDHVYATNVRITENGSEFDLNAAGETVHARIPVPGMHMVSNALMAAAVGLEFGVSMDEIAAGLAAVEFTGGRLQRKEVKGVVFIDDSYNANPDSMKAALDTFSALTCEGKKFIVAGGMAELGSTSEEAHAGIGKIASQSGVDFLVSVGETARAVTAGLNGGTPAKVAHFDNQQSCAAWLKAEARAGDMVLVKGSRSSAMEKVIEEFSQES